MGHIAAFSIFHSPFSIEWTGGHEGTRTPNFLLVREAVYQLTYVPNPDLGSVCPISFQKNIAHLSKMSEMQCYESGVSVSSLDWSARCTSRLVSKGVSRAG